MKTASLLIGIVLLLAGIAGFFPALSPDGVLFGVLPMDMVRSALFIVTGFVGIAIGMSHRRDLAPPIRSGHDLRDL